jgi:hypothetical protein
MRAHQDSVSLAGEESSKSSALFFTLQSLRTALFRTAYWRSLFSTLKTIFCVVVCLTKLSAVFAQDLAPQSIANTIRQVIYISSPTNTPGPFSFLHANNGGIYSVGLPGIPISKDASYVWVKTGTATGTLQTQIVGSPFVSVEFLTFTSSSAGTFRNSANTTTGTFRFTPFELGDASQVRNASSRTTLVAGQPSLIGFVIAGSAQRRVLVRAVGPTLAIFGVNSTALAPVLTVIREAVPVATSGRWGGEPGLAAAFASVGAFALPASSADSALLLSLEPGAYTAQVHDAVGGEILVEVYFLN